MKNKNFFYTHPNTVWEIVKAELEMGIINGVYNVGERVPSINELAKQYDISVNTAGKVLESLRNDDIVMKRRGIGYFVLPYGKTKLIKTAKTNFEKTINEMLKEAKQLGYEKEELINIIKDKWDTHRKDEE